MHLSIIIQDLCEQVCSQVNQQILEIPFDKRLFFIN
jgi:hypothetical protein